jgi:curli biogenesis system outer membrane secretion channel CsgG
MKRAIATLAATSLIGCATTPAPVALSTAGPASEPVTASSYFRDALGCMDGLLARAGGNRGGTRLTAWPVRDPTSAVNAGTQAMIFEAAMAMSRNSRFFVVVDPINESTVASARIMVRGEITEFDRGVMGQSQSGGLGIEAAEIGAANNFTVSGIALQLRMVELGTGSIIPGAQATHRVALTQLDRGTDLRAEVGTLAGFLDFRVSRQQALHQSVKALIDLSMIQIVGEYAQVPYEQCLSQASVTADAAALRAEDWAQRDDPQRLSEIAAELRARGYYNGPVVLGVETPALRAAVAAFQRDAGLPATGRAELAVFNELQLGREAVAGAAFPTDSRVLVSVTPASSTLTRVPAGTYLSNTGYARHYLAPSQERVVFSATLNRPGYLLCLNQSAAGDLVRVFPNDRRPERLINGDETVVMPNAQDQYEIRADWDFNTSLIGDRTNAALAERANMFICFGSDRPFSETWPAQWGPVDAAPASLPLEASPDLSHLSDLGRRVLARPIALAYLTMEPNWTPMLERSRDYTVNCYTETALVSAAPQLISVASGSVVYTSTVSGRAETEWCDDRPRTLSEPELMAQARADAVQQIRRHVAPYNDTFTVRLKTGNDGVPEALQAQNAGAVEFGQAGRMDRACAIWQEMDALNDHQSAPLLYNMGVCAEVVGDFERATQLYSRADSLLTSPDSLVSEALLRARSMQTGEQAIN